MTARSKAEIFLLRTLEALNDMRHELRDDLEGQLYGTMILDDVKKAAIKFLEWDRASRPALYLIKGGRDVRQEDG